MSALPAKNLIQTSALIEVRAKEARNDTLAREIQRDLQDLNFLKRRTKPAKVGMSPTKWVQTSRLYRLEGALQPQELEKIARELLVDPVIEEYTITPLKKSASLSNHNVRTHFDIWFKPGVTDPAGETIEKGIQDLGVSKPVKARQGMRYSFSHVQDPRKFVEEVIYNPLIHELNIH